MSTTLHGARLNPRHAYADVGWSAHVPQWAVAHPGLSCIALSLVYLATVAALTAVLMMQAQGTVLGAVVVVLFAIEALAFAAIAAYAVIPDR
jgi:hypothetical protein